MDDDALAERLSQFGLSEKEIDTYLTILKHGEAKASTIADDAGVSKRYVYSISENLAERGFVEVNDHVVPTKIRANPPEEAIEALSRSLDDIEPELRDRYTTTEERVEQFEVVKSRATVIKRVRTLLADAEEEVTLSLPSSMLPEVADELRTTVDRGVLVLLLVSGNGSSGASVTDSDLDGLATAARVWREWVPMLLTVDGETGLVAPSELIARPNSETRAIALAQPQLVPVLVGSFLGNYWPMADEVYTAAPAALPVTYDSFRHAVLQTMLYVRADATLRVTVEGRPVRDDGEFRTVKGEVVDVRQSLLDPPTNSFPVENALVVETDDGTYSVGGEGAFLEDYEARRTTLRAAD